MVSIAFICSELEERKNGVGDYTRRLACECTRLGAECQILAINDRSLQTAQLYQGKQAEGGTYVDCLRLPEMMSWGKRVSIAEAVLEKFSPDVVSLQFVVYGFHKKGLPLGLSRKLQPLFANRRVHFMFHELWLGVSRNTPLKHRIIGKLQKALVRRLIKRVSPELICTHCDFYRYELEKLGNCVEQMPLFGSVAFNKCQSSKRNPNTKVFRFIHFGGVYPGANVSAFAMELASISRNCLKTFEVVLIGRSGNEANSWRYAFEGAGIPFAMLGELSSDDVSTEMQTADAGLITTPWQLMGKSSSAAALAEHGLPIICLNTSWSPKHTLPVKLVPQCFVYEQGKLKGLLDACAPSQPYSNLTSVAARMLDFAAHGRDRFSAVAQPQTL